MSLTQLQLDKMTCSSPGCDHTAHDGLVFHSRCHPDAATWVEYKNGEMRVTCAFCERLIVEVAVAR